MGCNAQRALTTSGLDRVPQKGLLCDPFGGYQAIPPRTLTAGSHHNRSISPQGVRDQPDRGQTDYYRAHRDQGGGLDRAEPPGRASDR